MRLAFRMKPDSVAGRVVKLFTGAPTHVEPVFSDGTAFVARLGRPCGFAPPGEYPEPHWRVLDLAPLHLDEARIRTHCDALCGSVYDTPRALFGWWLGVDTVGRVICSEVSAESMAAAITDRTPEGVHRGLAQLVARPSTTPRRLLVAVEALLEVALEAQGVTLLRGQAYAPPTNPKRVTPEWLKERR